MDFNHYLYGMFQYIKEGPKPLEVGRQKNDLCIFHFLELLGSLYYQEGSTLYGMGKIKSLTQTTPMVEGNRELTLHL
jgi:hypothetical protein